MGTYTKIKLKDKRSAKKVNEILKKEYGLSYAVYNGVEYGYFYTEDMENEDIRFMNEDKEGLTQAPHFARPISRETFRHLTKYWQEIGSYMVKISCPDDENLKEIEILQKFLKTQYAKQYINYKASKNIDRLITLNLKLYKENNL